MTTFPDHLFIGFDGNMYDTRIDNWHIPPLRKDYAKVKMDVSNDTVALRAAVRNPFTFPGGYEFFSFHVKVPHYVTVA
jgi:hypothetical protein